MQTMNTPQEKNPRTKRIFVLAQKLNKLEAFLSVTCMNGMFQNINFCGQIWSEKIFFFWKPIRIEMFVLIPQSKNSLKHYFCT